MSEEERRIHELERAVAELSHLVTRLQQELLKASKYTHENPETRLEGVQVFLGRAGEAIGRVRKERGRR